MLTELFLELTVGLGLLDEEEGLFDEDEGFLTGGLAVEDEEVDGSA